MRSLGGGHRLASVYLQSEWRILVVTNADGGTGRLSYDPVAAERVRQLLSARNDVVEKMVGDLPFLVNGNMCCGITGDGADGPGRP